MSALANRNASDFRTLLALSSPPRRVPAILSRIQSIVAQAYGLSHRDSLVTASRQARYCVPRQVACYLCRRLTVCSLSEIASAFRQHHTSVMHSVDKVRRLISQDPDFAESIAKLEKAINQQIEAPSLILPKRETQPEWARRLEAKLDAVLALGTLVSQ